MASKSLLYCPEEVHRELDELRIKLKFPHKISVIREGCRLLREVGDLEDLEIRVFTKKDLKEAKHDI